jgi:mRNA interferase MazF
MKNGNIVLIPLPQSDGAIKRRPALLLKQMPPFNDWLLCGISTQL